MQPLPSIQPALPDKQIIFPVDQVWTPVIAEVFPLKEQLRVICDLCGTLIPFDLSHETPKGAQLCKDCHRRYMAVPEGKMRQSVERFLVGNVY
jgi:hypothetical protein